MKKLFIISLTILSLIGCSQPRTEAKVNKPKPKTYISNQLITTLKDSIKNSTEKETLKKLISDKKLSEADLKKYSSNTIVNKYKKQMDEYGGYALRVDADNDGVKDLFFVIDDGGTMGNNSRILLKGYKDGTYKMTSDKVNVTQELSFIKYKGKNYLIETSFSYDYKCYDGLDILYFKDGIIYEKVNLRIVADGYDISINTSDDSYKTLSKEASDLAKKHYDIANMDGEILTGDAETALEEKDYKTYEENLYFQEYHWFKSDINNDGKSEVYTKGIFYTSNLSSSSSLQNAFITDKVSDSGVYPDLISYFKIANTGRPMMFWVSTVGKDNILNLIEYDDLTNYSVLGYLIKGNDMSKVYEVKFKGRQKIDSKIYTRGVNYKDDDNGWE